MHYWSGGNYMPAFFMTIFGALLLVGLCTLLLSTFVMTRSAPAPRAAVTAGVALLIGLPVGLWLLPLGPTRPWLTSAAAIVSGLALFAILWRTFDEAWVPDEVARAADEAIYVFEPLEEAEPWELRNFLLRHWRGDLSLPVSYFLNNAILAGAAGFALGLIVSAAEGSETSLRALAALSLCYIFAVVLIWLWCVVGVWRSSGRHADRGGSVAWANVAKVMVVLGAVGMLAQSRSYFLQVREFGLLAAGYDPLGDPARVSLAQDGRTILIHGNLTSGTSQRFRDVLASAPQAREVDLTSPGGRMHEGAQIARMVRRNRLDTRVDEYCESACTFILLAGAQRLAAPEARVGFHQPHFPGQSEDQRRYAIRAARRDYRDAGISGDFLDRALSALPDEMWYPSHEQLLEANVVTSTELVVTAAAPGSKRPGPSDD